MEDGYRLDSHKLFWHLDRLSDDMRGKTVAPVYIEVSPTSVCNNKCVFCGIDFVRGNGKQLQRQPFLKALKGLGKSGVRSMMFAGEGEPLLHRDIAEFISVARSSGMDVSMTTNGSAATPRMWKEILPKLEWIRFSVDAGSPQTYAAVHGVAEPMFEKVLANIRSAVEIKKRAKLRVTLGVQFVVIEPNIADIPAAIRLFSRIGVDYFSIKPYSLHPRMKAAIDTRFTRLVIERIRSAIKAAGPTRGMEVIFREGAMTTYMDGRKEFGHCRALPYWGYISSDGDFYTCSVFIGDKRFRAGSIYSDSVKDILFGEKRRQSIEFGKKRLCIGKQCRTNCRMARVNEFLEWLENKPKHLNFI